MTFSIFKWVKRRRKGFKKRRHIVPNALHLHLVLESISHHVCSFSVELRGPTCVTLFNATCASTRLILQNNRSFLSAGSMTPSTLSGVLGTAVEGLTARPPRESTRIKDL